MGDVPDSVGVPHPAVRAIPATRTIRRIPIRESFLVCIQEFSTSGTLSSLRGLQKNNGIYGENVLIPMMREPLTGDFRTEE
jgi:hypothetical protein